jgi:hypothetical protein
VAFGRAAALDTFENCDVLDLASIRCPDKMAVAMTRPENQLSHLKTLAAILRDCGVEVLRGDFSSTHQIRELQKERMREWEREEARRGRPRPPRPNQPA